MNKHERKKILQRQVKEQDKTTNQKIEEEVRTRKEVLKFLRKKSKELGEKIPHEVLIVASFNIPVGSWFYTKYKKWLS